MEEINVVSTVLKYQDEYLFLLKPDDHDKARYDHASGLVEDEGVTEAALREIKEETGLDIDEDNLQPAPAYEFISRYDEGDSRYLIHPFLIDLDQKTWIEVSDENITHMIARTGIRWKDG
jgi:8-oxo-dGTP pyrophosphatase MutT (NUDIX family)